MTEIDLLAEVCDDPDDDDSDYGRGYNTGRAAMLAEVLDAVGDIDAIQRWASRSGVRLGSFIGHQQIRGYLADRFGTKGGT